MKKSSTNKKDTGKLEDVFRQAFEGAEERPPADLWGRIDQQLQSGESAHYRERMLWYRQLAAACLVLLIGLGAFTYYIYRTGNGPGPELVLRQENNMPDKLRTTEAGTLARPEATGAAAATHPDERIARREPGATGSAVRSPEMATPTLGRPSGGKSPAGATSLAARAERSTAPLSGTAREETPSLAVLPAKTEDKPTLPVGEGPSEAEEAGKSSVSPILAREENKLANEGAGAPTIAAQEEDTSGAGRTGEQPQPLPRALALQPEKDQAKTVLSANRQELQELLPAALRRSKWSVSSAYGAQHFAQNISLRNDFYGASRGMLSSSAPSNFAGNTALSTYDKAVDEFIQNTRPAYSFGAAVKAGYQLDRFWRVEAGFTYSHNESQTRTTYLVTGMNILSSAYRGSLAMADADVQESFKSVAAMPSATIMLPALAGLDSRFVSVNKTDDFTTRYRYRYVGVPLLLGFQSRESRSFVFATAGLIPQVLVQSSIIPDSPLASRIDFALSDESPFRRLNLAASASAGYGYRLSDELSLAVGPELQYFFAPLIRSSGINHIRQGNPYNVGVNLSARYTLRR